MDELLKYLGGAGLGRGELMLAWSVGIAAGAGLAVFLLLTIV